VIKVTLVRIRKKATERLSALYTHSSALHGTAMYGLPTGGTRSALLSFIN